MAAAWKVEKSKAVEIRLWLSDSCAILVIKFNFTTYHLADKLPGSAFGAIDMLKRRPPHPHSWNWPSCRAFHRAAIKPSTVTRTKHTMKMVNSPVSRGGVLLLSRLGLQPVDYGHEDGGDDDPKQLEPVGAWDADERWLLEVVERGPEHDDKRDEEKEEKPGVALSLRTDEHEVPP
jgi:hypothetical protein